MSGDIPSILSHVSIGVSDYARSTAFYDEVMPTIGCRRIMEHGEAVAYGKQFPEFWVQTPIDGQPSSVGNGTHIAFLATSKEQVNAFYQTALEAGATDDGGAGPRPHYGEPYYGCFVRDPDGHKIEAMYWDMELAAKQGA